jgi:hypothetical protein
MLKKKVKKELLKAVGENLPVDLTEEQANFWKKNPQHLSRILEGLSLVVVVTKPPK